MAGRSYRVGTASIAVKPDFKYFQQRTNAAIRKHEKSIRDLHVKVEPDTRELDRFKYSLAMEDLSLRITPVVDWDKFWAEVRAVTSLAKTQIDFSANLDDANAKRKLRALSRGREANLDAEVSTARAQAELAALSRDRLATVRVKLMGLKKAQRDLNTLARDYTLRLNVDYDDRKMNALQNERIAHRRADVAVNLLGVSMAEARLDALSRDRVVNITTSLEGKILDPYDLRKVPQLPVKLNPMFKELVRDIKAWSKAAKPQIDVGFNLQGTAEARAELAALTRTETKNVKVKVDQTHLQRAAAQMRSRLESMGEAAWSATTLAAKLSAVGLAASGAVPEVAALTREIGHIGKVANFAPAIVNSFAQIGAAAAVGLGGLGTHFEDLMSAYEDLEDGPPEGLNDIDAALWGLGENTKEAMKAVGGLRGEFKDLQNVAREALANGLGPEMEKLSEKYLPAMKDYTRAINTDLNQMVRVWGQFRRSGDGFRDTRTQLAASRQLMFEFTNAARYTMYAWNDMATVGSAFMPRMGRWLSNGARGWAEWAREARNSGEMMRGMERALTATRNVGMVTAGAFSVLSSVFRAASGDADRLTDRMVRNMNATREWAKSAQGQAQMSEFFRHATIAGDEFSATMKTIAGVFVNDLTPVLSAFLKGMGPGLRIGIEAIGEGIRSLERSAHSAGEVVGRFFMGFQAWGVPLYPLVNTVLPSLMKLLSGLAPVIGALAGPIGSLIIAQTAAHKMAPFLSALDHLMSRKYGKLVFGFSSVAGAVMALGIAFEPVAELLGDVARGLVDLNDATGGAIVKLLGVSTAVALVTKGVKNLRTAYVGLAAQEGKLGANGATFAATTIRGFKSATGAVTTHVRAIRDANAAYKGSHVRMIQYGAALQEKNREYMKSAAKIERLERSLRDSVAERNRLAAYGASAALEKSRKHHAVLVGQVEDLRGKYAAAVADSQGRTRALQSMGAAMRGGLAKTGSALLSLVGGPIGLAIGAVTALGLSFMDSRKRLKSFNEAMDESKNLSKRAFKDAFAAFESGASKIDAATKSLQAYRENLQKLEDGAPNWMNQFASGLTGRDDPREKIAADAKSAREAIEATGLTDEEIGKKIAGSRAEYEKFKQSLADNGDAGMAASMLDRLRLNVEQAEQAFRNMPDGMASARVALDKIKGSAKAAADDVAALHMALLEMNGINIDGDKIVGKAMSEINNAKAQMGQFAGARFDAEKGFSAFDGSGSAAASEFLISAGDNMVRMANAGEDYRRALSEIEPVLQGIAEASGTDVNLIKEKYRLTERLVGITAGLSNLKGMEELTTTLALIENAPSHKDIEINVKDQAAVDALEAMGAKVEDWNRDTGEAKLTFDSEEAMNDARNAFAELASFMADNPEAKLDLNTDAFEQKHYDALHALGIIDSATGEAAADIDITELDAKQLIAMLKLVDLANEKPKPIADADIEKLKTEASNARRELKNIPDKTVKVDANDESFWAKVGKIGRWVADVFTIDMSTPTPKAVRETNPTGRGGGASGWATGGRLPGYASGGRHTGYRLPLVGPGTNEVDGFTGLDEYGNPIARVDAGEWIINARSSEDYDRELAAINAGTFPKLPGYAAGGKHGDKPAPVKLGGDIGAALGAIMPNLGGDAFAPLLDAWGTTQADLQVEWANFQDIAASTWKSVADDTSTQWQGIGDNMEGIWDTTSNALTSGFAEFQAFSDSTWGSLSNVMGQTYQGASTTLQSITSGQIFPMLTNLQGMVGQTEQSFATGATGIGNQWARTREGVAAPIRYAISSVFNEGLVGMWNSAHELLDTPLMQRYPLKFADGGHVQGPGGPRDDKIPAMLSNGEYVINAKAVKSIGLQNLNALNSGEVSVAPTAFRGGLTRLMETDATWNAIAARYADGGPVKGTRAWEQLKRGYDWARSLNGRPYVLGGDPVGGGGTDCSGYMSSIGDRIQGGPGHRRWTTMDFNGGGNTQQATGPQGFVKGLSAGFSVGVKNGGPANGHTAGTIGGVPGLPAVNVESGGSPSLVKFGTGAVGADHGQFPTRYHLPIIDGEFVSGGGGSFVSIASLLSEAMSPSKKKLKNILEAWGNKPGHINLVPPRVGNKMGSAIDKTLKAKADAMDAVSGAAAGVDVSGISGPTQNVVREVFARHGWTGQQWEDAAWIIGRESSWNTTAVNPSSGAYGLFQFNPSSGTLQQYLPDRSPDPARQADAGARYIKDRYGNPSNARRFWEANGWYAKGGVLPGYTPGRDIHRIPSYMFSGGEAIMRPEWTRFVGGPKVVDQMNHLARTGRLKERPPRRDENGNEVKDKAIFSIAQWEALARSIEGKSRRRDWNGVADDLIIASEVIEEGIAAVDWGKVGNEVIDKTSKAFRDGHMSDIGGVLGVNPLDIPLVKATTGYNEARAKQAEEHRKELKQLKDKLDSANEREEKRLEREQDKAGQEKERERDKAERERFKQERERMNAYIKANNVSKEEAAAMRKALADKEKAATDARKARNDARQEERDAERKKNEAEKLAKEKRERQQLEAEYKAKLAIVKGGNAAVGRTVKNPNSPRAIQIRQAVLAFGQTADGIAGAVPTDLAGKFSKGRLRFAQGGFVPGKGGPTQDNIHAMLSAGEFIVRHASAQAAPGLMHAINASPAIAAGVQQVVAGVANGVTGSQGSNTTYEYHIHASNVDEGMRRAEMHARQKAASVRIGR